MTKKQIIAIICKDEAVPTGLGAILISDIAERILSAHTQEMELLSREIERLDILLESQV